MTDHRTEEAGVAGLLHLSVAGKPVDLDVLTIEQSERWQRLLGAIVSDTPVPADADPRSILGALAAMPTSSMLRLVSAYETLGACPESCPKRGTEPSPEHEHISVLGGPTTIKRRMTQRELYDALLQMARAEYPFWTDLRSVASAFGPQIQQAMMLLMAQVADRYLMRSSTPTPSDTGDSLPERSEGPSPVSRSTSSGSTTRQRSEPTPVPA